MPSRHLLSLFWQMFVTSVRKFFEKHAVGLEPTMTGFADQRLSPSWRHVPENFWNIVGTGGEIRTLKTSLEDSDVAGYITPAHKKTFKEPPAGFEPAPEFVRSESLFR